ncbi:MAG TPA: FKBP-type peptidyl-prolyl cis-trans isomerase [Nitrososphaerales archaeon]|nr:FKBP-type peptidyl-prolyl cis-trans isomerase [Nitrososphaerales archaeon]
MPFAKGALVYVNYTAKVKDTGETIETTLEDQAKKLDIYDADRRYEPRLVAVGEEWVLKGLDEEIAKMDVGEKKTAELPPDKAWGDRDPTLLRMVPLRKFGEKADELRVGEEVEMDDRIAVIRFIGSGRAQVDFNHRLAGKTLIYEIEALRKVEPGEDTIRSLMKRRFPGEGEKMEFSQKEGEVAVTIPEEAFLVEGLQIIKRGIANDILHFVPDVKKVAFNESYPRRESGREKGKSTQAAAESATKAKAEAPEKEEKQEEKQTA